MQPSNTIWKTHKLTRRVSAPAAKQIDMAERVRRFYACRLPSECHRRLLAVGLAYLSLFQRMDLANAATAVDTRYTYESHVPGHRTHTKSHDRIHCRHFRAQLRGFCHHEQCWKVRHCAESTPISLAIQRMSVLIISGSQCGANS